MTNVEAIEILRANYPDACYEQFREAVDAAIEALKALDATGDTIHRQAAVELAMKYCPDDDGAVQCDGDIRELLDELENLPSAQPEPSQVARDIATIIENEKDMRVIAKQRWIPCSERLPEEKDAGILKKLGTSKRSDYVLATVEVKGERMTVTACTYDGVWDWKMKYAFPEYEIVAWMPLPDPWKGENHERLK